MRKFIDFPSKPRTLKAMRQYLADHFRRGADRDGIANKVKLWELNLTTAERDACFEALGEESVYFASGVNSVLEAFDKANAPYAIYSAGRSDGYFVLHYNGQYSRGAVWANPEDLENNQDLRDTARIVYEFDKACNNACAVFVDWATSTQGGEAK